jgi:hypothetical protein
LPDFPKQLSNGRIVNKCRIFSIGEIDEMDTVYEGFSVTNADAKKNKQEITMAP